MTTLITGGSGLIGTEIAAQLGDDVVAYDLEPPAESPPGVAATVEGDVADRAALAEAVAAHDVDRIVHLAAMIGGTTNERPTAATQANVVGTDNVLSVAREAGVDRVVWASTHSVYGDPDQYDGPVGEEVRPEASFTEFPDASYYAAIKQLNEFQSRLYAEKGLEVHAVRPSFVFGPGRERGWKGNLIDDALAGEGHIPHPPDAEINFVYVADVAALFARLLTGDPAHHVYNTGGHRLTMRQVADVVAEVTGGTVTCDPDGGRLSFPVEYDYDRARTDLGYELTPFAECVRDYVERVS
ncbi:MAG: NAD-dependent epimerase/dehydratase family protein [Haloferacaceae archaeon]